VTLCCIMHVITLTKEINRLKSGVNDFRYFFLFALFWCNVSAKNVVMVYV
jgi:hypothetical protein